MNPWLSTVAIAALTWGVHAPADSTEARCDVYPVGEDHTDVVIPCTFAQRHGYITITRSDGVIHDLSAEGDTPGHFRDQHGNRVYRQSGLGDQGQIFRLPEESIYVYWNPELPGRQGDENNWTAPFTTDDFDATTRLRCRAVGESRFGSCPAGVATTSTGEFSLSHPPTQIQDAPTPPPTQMQDPPNPCTLEACTTRGLQHSSQYLWCSLPGCRGWVVFDDIGSTARPLHAGSVHHNEI